MSSNSGHNFYSLNGPSGGQNNNNNPPQNAGYAANTAGGPGEGGNPILQYYRQWQSQTPLITRVSMITIIVMYILSFFLPLDMLFGNIPRYTIQYFEVYRIFMSCLVGNSILTIILLFLFFPQMASRMENALGSLHFAYLMLTLSTITNVSFDIICYFFYLMGISSAVLWSCSGIWNIIFSLLTIECMQMPEAPRQFMFIPVNIPSKYMPLLLFFLFSLFSGPQLDFLISMIVGYLHSRGYFDRLFPSSHYFQELEGNSGSSTGHVLSENSTNNSNNSTCLSRLASKMSQCSGYVSANNALGYATLMPMNGWDNNANNNMNNNSSHGNANAMNSGYYDAQGMQSMQPMQGQDPYNGSGSTGGQQFFTIGSRNTSGYNNNNANNSYNNNSNNATTNPMSSLFAGFGGQQAPNTANTNNTMFPGSGRSLGTTPSASSSSSSSSPYRASQPSQSSRDEMIAKRLAVYGNKSNTAVSTSQSSGGSPRPSPLPSASAYPTATVLPVAQSVPSAPVMMFDNETLNTLLEMGFPREQAESALMNAGGDMELAMQILTSQP